MREAYLVPSMLGQQYLYKPLCVYKQSHSEARLATTPALDIGGRQSQPPLRTIQYPDLGLF